MSQSGFPFFPGTPGRMSSQGDEGKKGGDNLEIRENVRC